LQFLLRSLSLCPSLGCILHGKLALDGGLLRLAAGLLRRAEEVLRLLRIGICSGEPRAQLLQHPALLP